MASVSFVSSDSSKSGKEIERSLVDEPVKRPLQEQLVLGGILAPALRRQDVRTAGRRVKTLDKEGNVVGEVTLSDVQKGVLDAAGLQFDIEGRPERVLCTRCRKVLKIPGKGKIRSMCDGCRVRVRHEHDPPEARWKFLAKMVAIAKTGRVPKWVPLHDYKKRYGERPPVEWLERLGLR